MHGHLKDHATAIVYINDLHSFLAYQIYSAEIDTSSVAQKEINWKISKCKSAIALQITYKT